MGICAPQSKIPGKPINKGFPGIVNYSYSTVAGGLGVFTIS